MLHSRHIFECEEENTILARHSVTNEQRGEKKEPEAQEDDATKKKRRYIFNKCKLISGCHKQ